MTQLSFAPATARLFALGIDCRRVIYGIAFATEIRNGHAKDVAATTVKVVNRPQLYAINGRPC